MSGRFFTVVLLAGAFVGVSGPGVGREQDPAPTRVKRTVYVVKHGSAAALAAVLAQHFKEDAEIQAAPGAGNCLLVRAAPAVVEEVVKLVAELDRRPRTVAVELLLVDLPARAEGKKIDEKDFTGPDKEVLARVEEHRKKGLLGGLRRLQFTALENEPATLEVGEMKPVVAGVNVIATGIVHQNITYQNAGTRAQVTPRVSDGKAVVLELDIEHSGLRVREDAPALGKDENGQPIRATDFTKDRLRSKVSIPPGQVIAARDVQSVGKSGQVRTLILATARLVEPPTGAGK